MVGIPCSSYMAMSGIPIGKTSHHHICNCQVKQAVTHGIIRSMTTTEKERKIFCSLSPLFTDLRKGSSIGISIAMVQYKNTRICEGSAPTLEYPDKLGCSQSWIFLVPSHYPTTLLTSFLNWDRWHRCLAESFLMRPCLSSETDWLLFHLKETKKVCLLCCYT